MICQCLGIYKSGIRHVKIWKERDNVLILIINYLSTIPEVKSNSFIRLPTSLRRIVIILRSVMMKFSSNCSALISRLQLQKFEAFNLVAIPNEFAWL